MSSGWSSFLSRPCLGRARSCTRRSRGSRPPAEDQSPRCSSRSSPTPSTSSPCSETTSTDGAHARSWRLGESPFTRARSRHHSAAASRWSTTRASARSSRSVGSSTHAATTRGSPGTSSHAATPCTSAPGTPTLCSWRGARASSSPPRGSFRLSGKARSSLMRSCRAGRTTPSATRRDSSIRSPGSS